MTRKLHEWSLTDPPVQLDIALAWARMVSNNPRNAGLRGVSLKRPLSKAFGSLPQASDLDEDETIARLVSESESDDAGDNSVHEDDVSDDDDSESEDEDVDPDLIPLLEDLIMVDKPIYKLGSKSYWWLGSDRNWTDLLSAISSLEPREALYGDAAEQAIEMISTSEELHVIQLGGEDGEDSQWLASYIDQDGLFLCSPLAGIYHCTIEEAERFFVRHMNEYYSGFSDRSARAWVVPHEIDIRVVWLQDAPADTAGCIQLDRQVRNGRVIFHCLESQVDHYVTQFEDSPDVIVQAMQDWFDGDSINQTSLGEPDFDDLERTVGFILQETLDDNPTEDDISNAEFVFSLWTLWKQGGYCLKSRVHPATNLNFTLSAPPVFGIDMFRTLSSIRLRDTDIVMADGDRYRAILQDDDEARDNDDIDDNVMEFLFPQVAQEQTVDTSQLALNQPGVEFSRLVRSRRIEINPRIMCSTHRSSVVKRALEFFILEWFWLQTLRQNQLQDDHQYGLASGFAQLSALYTGMASPNSNDDFTMRELRRFYMPTRLASMEE